MGLVDSPAMGNGSGNGIPKLSAGKYRRMDAQFEGDEQESNILEAKGSGSCDSRKYVLGCAIFASLNSVLLGYGGLKARTRRSVPGLISSFLQ